MISVIVPIFKGMQYVPTIISNIERCKLCCDEEIELIFVNDYIQECFGNYYSDIIEIYAIENEYNIGIHASRVKGLEYSRGQYITFLDQDDWIDDNYFQMQLKHIGNADAVLCLASENNAPIYRGKADLTKAITKEVMYAIDNTIRSPGQALIRKESIPKYWIKNIVFHNCSDDYFLWICMINEKKDFAFNFESFYHHTLVEGQNTSSNTEQMLLSTREVLEYCDGYLPIYDYDILSKAEIQRFIRIYNGKTRLNHLHELLLWCSLNNNKVIEFLNRQNIYSISIYGVGNIGKKLYYVLKNCVNISHLYDEREFIIDGKPTERIDGCQDNENDCIIVSFHIDVDCIAEKFSSCKFVAIESFLEWILSGGGNKK